MNEREIAKLLAAKKIPKEVLKPQATADEAGNRIEGFDPKPIAAWLKTRKEH